MTNALEALPAKWRDEQVEYPGHTEGEAAAAAVRLCARELEAALADRCDVAREALLALRLYIIGEIEEPMQSEMLKYVNQALPSGAVEEWHKQVSEKSRKEIEAGNYVTLDELRASLVPEQPAGEAVCDECGHTERYHQGELIGLMLCKYGLGVQCECGKFQPAREEGGEST